MELKKLEHFRDQVKEIKMLENRIKELEQDMNECVSDSVRASSKVFPYIQHTVRITGVDARKVDKIRRVRERLNQRKIKLYHDMNEVEKFIDDLEDSKLRQIIELRYINGRTWNSVAFKVYGQPNGETARKKVIRYFKKI